MLDKFAEIKISNFDSQHVSLRTDILEPQRDGLALLMQQTPLELRAKLGLAEAYSTSETGVWPSTGENRPVFPTVASAKSHLAWAQLGPYALGVQLSPRVCRSWPIRQSLCSPEPLPLALH